VQLVQRFQGYNVWSLCNHYYRPISDNPAYSVEIRIGGRMKRVSDYAGAAPSWFRELEDAIDEAADTHRFRHGDPASESLLNAYFEFLPKPGVTKLMRAAARDDEAEVRALLANGASVDAADSSGWTAAMYAAASSHFHLAHGALDTLAKAGADLKRRSLHLDTVLMAATQAGEFPSGLAPAAGDINDQNADGVTVLMLLAEQPRPDQIKAAIKSGALLKVRDAKGRVALDYLEAANCRASLLPRSPVLGPVKADPECRAIDPKTYAEAKRLLGGAGDIY
jgi:hypothetical protein